MYRVQNAIIMAAGTSSRFAPLSFERHKALISVKGEILIERQIKQLRDAGIKEIIIVTGYKAEQFKYLREKFDVKLIYNPDYLMRNNNGSIHAIKDYLCNSYVCSADNYFSENPFEKEVDDSYYAALYSEDYTNEWCMTEDDEGYISSVTIGGSHAWYMMGHTFWNDDFCKEFIRILESEYEREETVNKLWESIYVDHLDTLKMRIKKYPYSVIFEFDSLDELRLFDSTYISDTRSPLIKRISSELKVPESRIVNISGRKTVDLSASGFTFECDGEHYSYEYETNELKKEIQ